MRLLIILAILLLAFSASAKTPMIGDHVKIYMTNGVYVGEVESCDLGFMSLNCTEYHDLKDGNSVNGLYSPSGWPVCLGISQIISVHWVD
jgi:hypothetical protein